MDRGILLVLTATLAHYALAQTASPTPLGVLITPPHRVAVSDALRFALPTKAVVRLVQSTSLAPDGETIVIYETGNKFEPHSHLAVIKERRLVADFSLAKLFEKQEVGDTYALFAASQLRSPDSGNAFAAAFRNIGNGAGTLFVLVANTKGRYHVIWQHVASQGRLAVKRDGKFQLWDALIGDNCTWCDHQYEVTTFAWKGAGLSKLSHWVTKNAMNPGPISNRPILIEK